MLKLPQRRKSYSSYYQRTYYQQPKRRISWWWVGLSIPIGLIILEIVAQIFLSVTGQNSELTSKSSLVKAYQLKFLTENEKPIEGLHKQGKLAVKRSSSVGYELVTDQQTPYWQINAQGVRDQEPLPLTKPKNEIRIFILGSSTAFGKGSSSNEATIAQQLENRLQQRVADQKQSPEQYRPDVFPFFPPSRAELMKLAPKIQMGQYRVINAAIPGYTTGNQLTQFALKILPYQPDVIIVLDGYEDLMLPSQQTQADIPEIDGFLADAKGHFQASVNRLVGQTLEQAGIVRTVDTLIASAQASVPQNRLSLPFNSTALSQAIGKDEAELKRRIERYQSNQKQLVQLASKAGIPVVLAVQPEITSRSLEQLTPSEKNIREQLTPTYLERVSQGYQQLNSANSTLAKAYPSNIKATTFYRAEFKGKDPLFVDNIHLTDQGNALIADQLYQTIAGWEKFQIIPQHFYLKDQ